ncbi:ankyrin repeat-containing domain protein, partial [Mycena galericulata]
MEDGSSQYVTMYQLHHLAQHRTWVSDRPLSPLCMCSKIGYTAGVHSLLIKHNASVNQAGKDGWTALHFASENGHLDIVQLLIEHNASVNQPDKDG